MYIIGKEGDMGMAKKIAGFAARRMTQEEKTEFGRSLLSEEALALNPEMSAEEHHKHATSFNGIREFLYKNCEEEVYVTNPCSPGCEYYSPSLACGGCRECVRDKVLAPSGTTVTPDVWKEWREAFDYASAAIDAALPDRDAFYEEHPEGW